MVRQTQRSPGSRTSVSARPRGFATTLLQWFDSEAVEAADDSRSRNVDWLRTLPFIAMHLACLGVFWVGISPISVGVAILVYVLRMFAITGFYHRYFSHKAFRTSRVVQFTFALVGASAVQRGPLWWASHHRHHHVHSDDTADVHSPGQHGFLWSHMGWFLCRVNYTARKELIKDWLKFPELRFLDRFDIVAPALLAFSLYGLGVLLAHVRPEWGTDGAQMLVWGFVISTVALYHATFMINSLAHVWGKRRFITKDDSRNNPLLAIITLGEGWHNNHHHYPASARQGFYWWEFDPTYYALRFMASLGLIWDLKPLPADVLTRRRQKAAA